MGGRLNEVLVPARFMLTLGHLVAVLMLDATKSANISRVLANDASNSQYQAAKFEFQVAYIICLVCFGLDLVGLLSGASLFFSRANVLQIWCHFAGGCLIAAMIEQTWSYQYIWMALALTQLPTAIVEVAILVAIFGLKIVVF